MSRPRRTLREREGAARPGIVPNAVYTSRQAARLLNLAYRVLLDYAREGAIRSREYKNRRLFQGQWLLDWLQAQPAGRELEEART
jgi:hypothetical protein